MKSLIKWGVISSMMCWLVAVYANADTITNVNWTFAPNATLTSCPPTGSGLYSSANDLDWAAANKKLSATLVPNLGGGSALEFSYSGNHPEFLNGTILTLTSTVSGLPSRSALKNLRLSYDSKWNLTGNSVTETWAYSLNGGAFVKFESDAMAGNNLWQTAGSVLNGVVLNNGDTIALRDTISGAAGSDGRLAMDHIRLTSVLMPEASAIAMASFGGLATLLAVRRLRS